MGRCPAEPIGHFPCDRMDIGLTPDSVCPEKSGPSLAHVPSRIKVAIPVMIAEFHVVPKAISFSQALTVRSV